MTCRATTPLIDALTEARVLGEPAGEVEVIETHMSWVLLAGEHAYKIKKPVDLGFADFSTRERRRHYCREELRINRRLAPQLYVGLVPIYGKPEDPRLSANGEPIEYLVKMRRFRQEDRLDHVLDRDRLTPDEVDDAIRQMANFHGRVEVDTDQSGFGTPDAVRAPMEVCFESLSAKATDFDIVESLDCVRRWSDAEFDAKRTHFAARKRDGFIRECHGDMHLANMARWDGSVVIFDALEFNENLRWIDVQNELAFLVMDLEDRDRLDLARRALNRYLEITGDYRGLTLLPYYLAYRALVRAKVDRIRLNQSDIDEQEREPLRHQLAGYVRLAEAYSDRPSPRLIITRGVAATGKTTAASRLVEQLGAVRIRSDVERKRLFGLDPLARTGSEVNEGLYSPGHTRRCYGRLAPEQNSEIRSSKPETNSNARSANDKNGVNRNVSGISRFVFGICLVFRISCFEFHCWWDSLRSAHPTKSLGILLG